MTALTQYARLEAAALWRSAPDAQRRDVVVVLGDATLTVKDMQDRALTHWSLAAMTRANPGKRPAIFHPDGDPDETIELSNDEDEMIRALEKLRKAVERSRPRKGRLRGVASALALLAAAFVAVKVVPGALVDHALRVVPEVKRVEIGTALLTEIQRVTGPPCAARPGQEPLSRLAQRMQSDDGPATYLAIMRAGVTSSVHLPGGVILLSRTLVEDHESPDVIAGYILAEQARRHAQDPLRGMLEASGTWATLRLLTSGSPPASATAAHAISLLSATAPRIEADDLLVRFDAAGVASTPYAYALDISGEQTLNLIEADPYRQRAAREVLSDSDWVRLQTICEL